MVEQKLRPSLIIIPLLVVMLLLAGLPSASLQQASAQFATPTQTATSTQVGPSPTPTATLPAPPENSGRVSVEELAVRSGPGEEFPILGRFGFGDVVTPIAIDAGGGVWVAINWAPDQVGWIASNLVEWDPSLNFSTLPFIESTPIPDGFFLTGTPDPNGPTQTPTPTITSVPTLTPTAEAAESQEAAEEASPSAEETDEEVVVAPVGATPSAPSPTEMPAPIPVDDAEQSEPINPRILTFAGLGAGAVILAIVGVLYGQRRTTGRRELTRYAQGFPIENCPVCRVGDLQLEEKVNGALGIPSISRTVRCTNCRSLLREIEPGTWRYNIDPYVNPQLAYKYNTQRFTDADLLMLVQEAQQYEPVVEQTVEGVVERANEAEDIVDLLPEIEPLISEIEKAQEEERQRRFAEENSTQDDDDISRTSSDKEAE